MPRSDLLENGKLVDQMRHTIIEGETNIQHIPQLVRDVIEREAWKERWLCGHKVVHKTFLEFVNGKPLAGMGWDKQKDKERVASLLRNDLAVLEMWEKALMLPAGSNRFTIEHNNVIGYKPVKQGNSLAYTLRRLNCEKHKPLYDKVIAGEMSANAAAIEAGFRKKPVRRCPKCGHEW